MATNAERLAAYQTAIAKIEANPLASYSMHGRTFTYRDLGELRLHEAYLERRVAREERGGLRVSRVIPID